MTMAALVRNWRLMAARGVFAMAFGGVLAMWPTATLSAVVILFAGYAIVDGLWTIGVAMWASERPHRWEAWPVALEGLVSAVIGVVALGWPWVPRHFIYLVATWGFVTGALALLTAFALPRHRAQHWIMGTAAASSLFLALLLMLVPFADAAPGVALIAAYAVIAGALTISAAVRFLDSHANVAARGGVSATVRAADISRRSR
jgi:uncharacterized membrane protein HdeD (DUF308 family)